MTQAAAELDYTQRMNADINWALREGGLFFQNECEVQHSLRRLALRLNALGTNYAVVGGMALFLHGFRRYTENINILVTREGLPEVHHALLGNGYRLSRVNSSNLHDMENGVYIKFMVSGDVPDPQRIGGEAGRRLAAESGPALEPQADFRDEEHRSVERRIGRAGDDQAASSAAGFRRTAQFRVFEHKYEELWQGSQPDPNSLWNEDKWPEESLQG